MLDMFQETPLFVRYERLGVLYGQVREACWTTKHRMWEGKHSFLHFSGASKARQDLQLVSGTGGKSKYVSSGRVE